MSTIVVRVALGVVPPVMVACLFIGHPAAGVVFAVAAAGLPVVICALGAARQGSLGPLAVPLLVLLVCLVGCFVTMLALRGEDDAVPASAIVLAVAGWLVPLAVVSFSYAATFDDFTLREEDLERLRRLVPPDGED